MPMIKMQVPQALSSLQLPQQQLPAPHSPPLRLLPAAVVRVQGWIASSTGKPQSPASTKGGTMDARPLTVLEESDVRSLRSSTEGVIWQGIDFPDAPPMPHSSSIGLGQLVSSGGTLTNEFAGCDLPASTIREDSDQLYV